MFLGQEIFDIVSKHLLTQNCQSFDDNERSMYFGPWGRKCAIGCLIPPEHYDPKIEGYGVCLIRFYRPGTVEGILATALIKSGVDVGNKYILDILIDLQECHDVIPTDRWYCELDAIAHRHGLAFSL
jgi:hypothetical protein